MRESLESERLILRRSVPADAEAIAAYRNDPDVRRYQGWGSTGPEEVRASIEEMATRAPGESDWVQFSVFERESGVLVGDVGLSPSRREPGVIKIGYTIGPAHQGRGYGTEAVALLIDFVFGKLRPPVVRMYADADNSASIRVAEKVGMRHMETFEETEDGETWTGVRYEISAADRPG
jgi:RimJ/RimL family protein N-acetyltransferase